MSFHLVAAYISSVIIIAGFIGNLCNILLFTRMKLFRGHQAAFYLFVASTIDSLQLLSSGTSRTINTLFGIDLSRSSLILCKQRGYIAAFSSSASMYIICLAALDQYLSTHALVQLRQLSRYRSAQYSSLVMLVISLLYNIPFLIFYEIQPISGCNTYDSKFNYFFSFVHFSFLAGLLPLFIASLFSLLAFSNVRRIVRRQIPLIRRRLDRQLTAMILLRVILLVGTTLPFLCIRIYQMNFRLHPVDVERILQSFITLTYTLNYSVRNTDAPDLRSNRFILRFSALFMFFSFSPLDFVDKRNISSGRKLFDCVEIDRHDEIKSSRRNESPRFNRRSTVPKRIEIFCYLLMKKRIKKISHEIKNE